MSGRKSNRLLRGQRGLRRNLQGLSVEAQLLPAFWAVPTIALNNLHRSLQLKPRVEKVPTFRAYYSLRTQLVLGPRTLVALGETSIKTVFSRLVGDSARGKQGLLSTTPSRSTRTRKGKHDGSKNGPLEAEAITEQSGFQNELHQISPRFQQTTDAHRRISRPRLHDLHPCRRIVCAGGSEYRSLRAPKQTKRIDFRLSE